MMRHFFSPFPTVVLSEPYFTRLNNLVIGNGVNVEEIVSE